VQSQSLARRLTAEGLGTALLLATIVGSGIMGERLSGAIQRSRCSAIRRQPGPFSSC
jgi:hypothetical protein